MQNKLFLISECQNSLDLIQFIALFNLMIQTEQ